MRQLLPSRSIKSLLIASAVTSTGLCHAQVAAPPEVEAEPSGPTFMRVVDEPGESLSLEVGSWKFIPREGKGPAIALVSVAHIGDASLYAALQALLDEFDVVLYESVKPSGATRPSGENDAERRESTLASMRFLGQMVELYEDQIDSYPANSGDLSIGLSTIDPRLARWVELALVDAWENPLEYKRFDDGFAFTITSLGSDGAIGGDSGAVDLRINSDTKLDPFTLSSEDGLQAQLADALGMHFQLNSINYSAENWICSDMTVDQVNRGLREQGIDFAEFGGSLAGTSFSGKMVKALLSVLKVVDMLAGGMVSDMAKVMMIDVLGDDSLTEKALNNQFGEGFADVIIDQRNQVVMDDLKRLLKEQPDVGSVAIFYGAAHMPDFAARLDEQLGYVPDEVIWVPAMTVNLRTSAMSEAEIRQMRDMLKMTLDRMK